MPIEGDEVDYEQLVQHLNALEQVSVQKKQQIRIAEAQLADCRLQRIRMQDSVDELRGQVLEANKTIAELGVKLHQAQAQAKSKFSEVMKAKGGEEPGLEDEQTVASTNRMQMLESQSRVLQAQFDARKEEIRQYYHSKAPIVKQIQEVDDELRRAQDAEEELMLLIADKTTELEEIKNRQRELQQRKQDEMRLPSKLESLERELKMKRVQLQSIMVPPRDLENWRQKVELQTLKNEKLIQQSREMEQHIRK